MDKEQQVLDVLTSRESTSEPPDCNDRRISRAKAQTTRNAAKKRSTGDDDLLERATGW